MGSRSDEEYELPRECWEKIVSFLDQQRHFETLSLVNKLFLSITNSLRTHFSSAVTHAIHPPSVLRRFPNVTYIYLRIDESPPLQLIQLLLPNLISLSLPDSERFPRPEISEPFTNLKRLMLPRLGTLHDHHLSGISHWFPSLEEIDLSDPCEGSVKEMRSLMKLKRLKKINLSGNVFVTDRVLGCLLENCAELREIWLKDCFLVSEKGIAELIRKKPELESLYLSNFGYPTVSSEETGGFRFARGLRSLGLLGSFVTDDLLGVLADVNLPLRELLLSHSNGFSFEGLMELIMSCQEIEVLDLKGVSFLSDNQVAALCKVLRNLISVDFRECVGLTHGILYTLARYCPKLREIRLGGLAVVEFTDKSEIWMDPLPKNENTNLMVNRRMNLLSLANDSTLNDHYLKAISHLFANLQHLDVSACSRITVEGLSSLLEGCNNIEHLNISRCSGIDHFPSDEYVLNLEVLVAQGLGFDCHDMSVIAGRCPRLRCIDLKSCCKVATPGVKQLVDSCKLLKEVSLQWCGNVDVEVVAWMIFKRPSLRRIVPPKGLVLSKNQTNFFLRHGCLVRDG